MPLIDSDAACMPGQTNRWDLGARRILDIFQIRWPLCQSSLSTDSTEPTVTRQVLDRAVCGHKLGGEVILLGPGRRSSLQRGELRLIEIPRRLFRWFGKPPFGSRKNAPLPATDQQQQPCTHLACLSKRDAESLTFWLRWNQPLNVSCALCRVTKSGQAGPWVLTKQQPAQPTAIQYAATSNHPSKNKHET